MTRKGTIEKGSRTALVTGAGSGIGPGGWPNSDTG